MDGGRWNQGNQLANRRHAELHQHREELGDLLGCEHDALANMKHSSSIQRPHHDRSASGTCEIRLVDNCLGAIWF